MVTSKITPFSKNRTLNNPPGHLSLWDRQSGYRQRPIVWSRNLPYFRWYMERLNTYPSATAPGNIGLLNGSLYNYCNSFATFPKQQCVDIHWKAFERLKDGLGATAELGITLVQGRQALSMIGHRALVLMAAAKALRKGRFRDFLRILQVRPKERHKDLRWSKPKRWSNLWLEYWFGWKPLVMDIGDAVAVLQNEFSSTRITATASERINKTSQSGGNGWVYTEMWRGRKSVKLSAEAFVTNPNLALANQLGFANPALVLWDLVPFSFIVDWFIPVNKFLSRMNPFLGFELLKPYSTFSAKGEVTYLSAWNNSPRGGYDAKFAVTQRFDTLELPAAFTYKGLYKLSPSRAATATSLLIALFTKG